MAPRTRREREQFFADLDRLDHLDEDETSATTRPQPAAATPEHLPSPERPTRKRKISSPTNNRPIPPKQVPEPAPEEPRPSTSDATTQAPAIAVPPTLRRTQSDKVTSTSKGRKGKKTAPEVPVEDRVFQDLVLFFIPNSDADPVRRFRIRNAIAHGATWARSWENSVTHVVVDTKLHIERASRELRDKSLPTGVPLISDEWLVECIKYRDLRDPNGQRFRVLGMTSPFEIAGTDPAEGQPSRLTKMQKPGIGALHAIATSHVGQHQAAKGGKRTEELHHIATGWEEDELDLAIAQTNRVGELPSSIFAGDDFPPESDPPVSSFEDDEKGPYPRENKGFQCMELNDGDYENPNARTMAVLQELASHYQSIQDKWRPRAYRMAIGALRKQMTLIGTKEEAMAVRGIGESIAGKIEEFIETDRIRRLDNAKADPTDKVLGLFMGVYGAGFAQASRWVAQGFRTLDDLRNKAELTPNQKVGIDHYEDFESRVPRKEVEQHANIVKDALSIADKGLEMTIGGSYRRGNLDSGDIDLIVTRKGAGIEHLRVLVMDTVVPQLTEQGFLKAALATWRSRKDGSTWHGACALPGVASPWRRLDILLVPETEIGAALIYFTGNDIFNRSIRLLASRKDMRLNQHGLFKDVMRGKGRVKVTDGELLEGRSERRIFELLGVPYRPPEHRRC